MNYFEELLPDRGSPYEIDLELKVRKILERGTGYKFEFQKNVDKYGYDLSVFFYDIQGENYFKNEIAFIEIEISETWKEKYPEFWKDYSFCKRKVYEFDYDKKEFTNVLKQNSSSTVYLVFNKSITDSMCQSMNHISKLITKTRRLTGDVRCDTFLTTAKEDDKIVRGIKNCLCFCREFIQEKAKKGKDYGQI